MTQFEAHGGIQNVITFPKMVYASEFTGGKDKVITIIKIEV